MRHYRESLGISGGIAGKNIRPEKPCTLYPHVALVKGEREKKRMV
jgi:hypothetical protein